MSAVADVWNRVQRWWSQLSAQQVYTFLPNIAAPAPAAQHSYLRLWLTDMSLARARTRAADVYPTLRASVRLSFGHTSTTFSTLVGPADADRGPGPRAGKLTELLPFAGGTVALQAALYEVKGEDRLRVAFDILAGFSSLLAPPLSTVAAVAERIASGIDKAETALDKAGTTPVLVLADEFGATPGLSRQLAAGHLVVVGVAESKLDKAGLSVVDGRLRYRDQPLDGYDYLVFEIETALERDDWRFSEWDELIREAAAARVRNENSFARLRDEVLARIWQSGDLTPTDRKRVAKLVQEELDEVGYGVSGVGGYTSLHDLVADRGLPPAHSVAALSLADLLAR